LEHYHGGFEVNVSESLEISEGEIIREQDTTKSAPLIWMQPACIIACLID
jgi:hypothetical protein